MHHEHYSHHRHGEHHHRSHEHRHRKAGTQVLDRVGIVRPGELPEPMARVYQRGALSATNDHIQRVQELFEQQKGTKLPVNADLIRMAYISQKARLNDKRITDEMTQSQYTYELMAKAILFAPQASDALKTPWHKQSKAILSQHNDILGEIARSLPAKLTPGQKTAVVKALELGSVELNNRIGHSSEISSRDHVTGISHMQSGMNGVSYEIAPENAIQSDPGLILEIPTDTASDLKGIDMMVTRRSDGRKINIDTKGEGKYLHTIADIEGRDRVFADEVGPYYFTRIHENGYPHYLLNSEAFGDIPAEGFDYTPEERERMLRTIHEMLDQ